MKVKVLPIISALFLVIIMAIQSAVSYHHTKENLLHQIEDRMELAQKDIFPTASLPVESLLAEVKAFIGDAEQVDVITLLVISKINNICSRNKSEQ